MGLEQRDGGIRPLPFRHELPEPPSDRELVERARTDPEAFGLLYDRYLDRIYSYHRHRLGSLEAAEDATHDTFFSALSRLESFKWKHEGSVPAWIFRIAHNQNVNLHRGSRQPTLPIGDDLESRLVSPFGEPEEEAEHNEEIARVKAAVLALPDTAKNIILLRFVADMQHADIASIVGKSEGAVKALLHRTLKKLKKELEGQSSKPKKGEVFDIDDED